MGVGLFLCVLVTLLAPILALSASASGSGQAQNGASPATQTFGKTTVGASAEVFAANRKRVNRYALPSCGLGHQAEHLFRAARPDGTAGAGGRGLWRCQRCARRAARHVTEPLTFNNTNAAGWYDLTFTTPLNLTAGNYWIGVFTGGTADVASYLYDSVTGSRDYNANTFTSGPTNPFGSSTTDSQQISLYATYTPRACFRLRSTANSTDDHRNPPAEPGI